MRAPVPPRRPTALLVVAVLLVPVLLVPVLLVPVLLVAVLHDGRGTTAGPPRPVPVPVALAAADGCVPGQVLDLRTWKLQLPVGQEEKPTEIEPVTLGRVAGSRYFEPTPDCAGVVFRAPVNGVTTKGSKNPRSELREMAGGGTGRDKAAWSAGSGVHWMAVTEAFTALPKGKPHLVGAQVHDDRDDITVFRLEGTRLYVTNGDDPHHTLVTDSYRLGTVFEAAFLVTEGMVGAYYNGDLVAVIERPFTGAYFKAGAYTQANCSNSPCSPDNYGETVIYSLEIGHS